MNNAQMTAEVRRQFIEANGEDVPVPPLHRSTNTDVNLMRDSRGNYHGNISLESYSITGEFGLPQIVWTNPIGQIIWDYITDAA